MPNATSPNSEDQPILSLSGVRKVYPGVVALSDFSMEVSRGEVIGLVGENGAGKSTLMKILGGVVAPDAGTITIDSTRYDQLSVAQSIAGGIAFVHQELNLFENLDVAANVYIGREPRTGGILNLVDEKKQREMTERLLQTVGANFSASARVGDLSLAQRQMVEIAKALSIDARIVILDEPTSSLPLAETDKLLAVISGLKSRGISVIFISHRLQEVECVADRVIVLRDGRLAGMLGKGEITHGNMVRLMIGRDLKVPDRASVGAHGAVALSVRGVQTSAFPRQSVDLELHEGEILGLAGLVGSGRTELARAIFGIDKTVAGLLQMGGKSFRPRSAADAVARGIYLVPEDRKGSGILLDLPIAENISLPNLPAHANGYLVSRPAEVKTAELQRRSLGIKTPGVGVRTGALSGGNQQKVVLGKWLAMKPKVMILDEPTRGIDIGAKSEIYRLMRELATAGVAVLMISSEMEETILVSDRIAVMHEGRIAGTLGPKQFSEENILLLAVGKSVREGTNA